MSEFETQDKIWDRFIFPFQTSVEDLQLPEECTEIRRLQRKYEEAKEIYFQLENNKSFFDDEDFEMVEKYVLSCKKEVQDFSNIKMSDKLVDVSLAIEKFNQKNKIIKEFLKNVHPLNILNDYFYYKQVKYRNKLVQEYNSAKDVDSLQSRT